MSTAFAPPVPPGWYQDPTTPNPYARRWWDGTSWTDHVATVGAPAAGPNVYPAFVPPTAPPRSRLDAFGWSALGLAVIEVLFGIVCLVLPALVPALVPTSIIAVGLAVVALVLRSRRRARALATPIIAIVLTVLISAFATLVWAGSTEQHNELEANTVSFPNSPELTQLFATTKSIERGIRAQHSAYSWPASVTDDAAGRVDVGGTVVGTLAPGETMSYQVTKGGEDFLLIVHARVPGEYFVYDLDTHEIDWFCSPGDDACNQ